MPSKDFNDLQSVWYKKLEESGFNDIEEQYPESNKAFLKTWDSHYFKSDCHGFYGAEFYRIKADYYYYAAQYLHQGVFDSEIEKEIWSLHSDGFGVRKSAEKLNEKFLGGRPLTRDKVWRIVKRLRLNMRAFLRMEGDGLSKEAVLDFRSKKTEDEGFIYATWFNNLYSSTRWRTSPTRESFLKYRNIIQHILSKPATEVKVCCLKEDPDVIVGYSVWEKTPMDTILHWVFVRNDWQRRGIARDLCPKSITVVTHMTKIGERIWEKQRIKPLTILLPMSYEILEAAV